MRPSKHSEAVNPSSRKAAQSQCFAGHGFAITRRAVTMPPRSGGLSAIPRGWHPGERRRARQLGFVPPSTGPRNFVCSTAHRPGFAPPLLQSIDQAGLT
jgi:hypothetical protein